MLLPKWAKRHVIYRLPFLAPPMKLLRQRQLLLNAVFHASTTPIAFSISPVAQFPVLMVIIPVEEFEDYQHVQSSIPSHGAPYGPGTEAVRFGQQPPKPRKAIPFA